jgi:LysR family transcriptional regulator, transcriptional activator of the cysJI operon
MNRLLPKIDTYHLLIFYHVCREQSITIAAEKLFLSQPTVTSHIKSLEDAIQMKLIIIDRKKLSLTRVGEGLYHYAREIFEQAMAADRYIEIVKESSLYIGVSPLLQQPITKTLNSMSDQLDSSIRLELVLGESLKLLKEVVESKIDLAVVFDLDEGFNNLKRVKVARGIQLVFYASPYHPIFQKEKIRWTDLGDYPLVSGSESSSIRKFVANKLISEGLTTPPKFYFTASNSELFTVAIRNRDCISLGLLKEIREDIAGNVFKALPLPDSICLDLEIVAYESHIATSLVQQFISSIRSYFEVEQQIMEQSIAGITDTAFEATRIPGKSWR